jgi:alpha-glucan, water dikinase
MADYKDGVVGCKSKNLAALRGTLPDWISLPASVTLPFGCFEQVLDARENASVKKAILDAAAKVSKGSAATHLAQCRDAVSNRLCMPKDLRKGLAKEMEAAGLPLPENEERWAAAERAIVGVWASKFNDRAFYSMRKVGLNFMDLRMAVLVQRVVPARYAFVIHTNNPSTGAFRGCIIHPPLASFVGLSMWTFSSARVFPSVTMPCHHFVFTAARYHDHPNRLLLV